MKEIKTKQTIKDIKVLDKTADVSCRAKNAFIRTKQQADKPEQNENGNYVDNAANSAQDGAKTIAWKAGCIAENYGKKAVKRIKKHREPDKDTPRPDASDSKNARQSPNSEAKETIHQDVARAKTKPNGENRAVPQKTVQIQLEQKSGRINKSTVQRPFYQHTERVVRQTYDSSRTAGRATNLALNSGGKTIKKAAKGTVKTVQKSVKTAGYTAKTRTSQTAARTTVKTVQAAQRAVQSARAAARMATVSAKTALKAMITTIKAGIAAVKNMIALIIAGGWVVVVIILAICLAGLLLGSVFGVFYSNESSDENTLVMTEVVSRLNNEFTAKLGQIKNQNPYDELEMSGNGSGTINNWREILAVYTIKVAADLDNSIEVATLDDAKVGILRGIFWNMNEIDHWIQTVDHEETITATDKDGNETKETVTATETVLHINIISKSHTDMIAEYAFNTEQVNMLNELMQDEYKQLFMRLIGG